MPAYATWVSVAVAVVGVAAMFMELGAGAGLLGLLAHIAILLFAVVTSIAMIRDRSGSAA